MYYAFMFYEIAKNYRLRERKKWPHWGIFILLADAFSPDDQVYRDIPAVLEDAHKHSQVG